jgi:hypothetical protein
MITEHTVMITERTERTEMGAFQFELSADNVAKTGEGIANCVENEIRALEESRMLPTRLF